ncbi:MAG: hypothetical protein LBG88_01075 [Christensenellaceae bacterium]|jgi:hypothetical protein|nr:hypothetical protein [Christensenellaceae bacterium]
MHRKFLNLIDKISKIADRNLLVIIALSVLGAVLLYEVAMTIILHIKKKHQSCLCNLVQLNAIRRWVACCFAWLFFVFAMLNMIHDYHPWDSGVEWVGFDVMYVGIWALPVAFLLAFYIIETLFTVLNRCKCNCNRNGGTKCECDENPTKLSKSERKAQKKAAKKEKKKGKKRNPEPVKHVEHVQHVEHPHPVIAPAHVEPELKYEPIRHPEPEIEPEPKPKPAPKPRVTTAPRPKAESAVPKITKPAEPRETPVRQTRVATEIGATPKPRATATPRPKVEPKPKLEPKETIARPRNTSYPSAEPYGSAYEHEQISELAARIERQRLRAEQKTDAMDAHGQLSAYSAQTRGALQETVDESRIAKEIAAKNEADEEAKEANAKMLELQRRMDALRQTVAPATVTRTQRLERTVDTTYVKKYNETDIRAKRSVSELKREQDGLKLQYENLQSKLEEIKYGKRQIGGSGTSVGVGYYSTPANFERTGERGYLSKISSSNKFDEDEVKQALLGLRHAIDDLQTQIDNRDD